LLAWIWFTSIIFKDSSKTISIRTELKEKKEIQRKKKLSCQMKMKKQEKLDKLLLIQYLLSLHQMVSSLNALLMLKNKIM